MSEIRDVIINNIKKKMAEHNMTATQLAKALDVNKSSVSYWLSGRDFPRSQRLGDIANALGCSVQDLFLEEKKEKPQTCQRGPLRKHPIFNQKDKSPVTAHTRSIKAPARKPSAANAEELVSLFNSATPDAQKEILAFAKKKAGAPYKLTWAAARVNAGLTQQEAADLAGLSITTLVSYEKYRHAPRISVMNKLLEIYNLPVENIQPESTDTVPDRKESAYAG